MEDNNAITKQPNAVNYEEEYNKVVEAYKQLYERFKNLENTWMLTRADFLFKIVDNNKFNVDIRQKAQVELENFLFPNNKENVNDKEA